MSIMYKTALFLCGFKKCDCLAYSKAGLSVWRPDNCIQTADTKTSFCFIISSQTRLPTSSLNRPRSQQSWLSHLSILNVPAWAGGRFALNCTTAILTMLSSAASVLNYVFTVSLYAGLKHAVLGNRSISTFLCAFCAVREC